MLKALLRAPLSSSQTCQNFQGHREVSLSPECTVAFNRKLFPSLFFFVVEFYTLLYEEFYFVVLLSLSCTSVQWHTLHFLLSPTFSFGGDTCGLQLWVFGVMLCHSHARGQAALQALFALGASVHLQLTLFDIWLQKLDKLLASSLPQLHQITVRTFEGCHGLEGQERKNLVCCCKKMRYKLKSVSFAFYFLLVSFPAPHLPFLCQKQWQKYLYVML